MCAALGGLAYALLRRVIGTPVHELVQNASMTAVIFVFAAIISFLLARYSAGIAALALGTETIPRVDKIVGSGDADVSSAKRLLAGHVAVDAESGEGEVCVVADKSATRRAPCRG